MATLKYRNRRLVIADSGRVLADDVTLTEACEQVPETGVRARLTAEPARMDETATSRGEAAR